MAKYSTGGSGGGDDGDACELCGAATDSLRTASIAGATLLSRYLGAGNWSLTNATMQGEEPVFTFRSSAVPSEPAALPENATDLREYGAVMVVDSDGRIRYFEATGTYTLDGTEASFTVSHRLVSEGPEVERPEWVERQWPGKDEA
jgi:hypothetical protein